MKTRTVWPKFLFVMFLLVFCYFVFLWFYSNVDDDVHYSRPAYESSPEIQRLQKKIGYLQTKILKLESQLNNWEKDAASKCSEVKKPNVVYQQMYRRLQNQLTEMDYFVSHRLNLLKTYSSLDLIVWEAGNVLDVFLEEKRLALGYLHSLNAATDTDQWMSVESEHISDVLQKRLRALQNPRDCSAARKLRCDIHKRCGFACQFHHVLYCMVVAYATDRTLVLNSTGIHYSSVGWEKTLSPPSRYCNISHVKNVVPWNEADAAGDADTVDLPYLDFLENKMDYIPLAIPEDLADHIKFFHTYPGLWWVGQFAKYLLRPRHYLASTFEMIERQMNFTSPIIGVHIRRTDKLIAEAGLHKLDEYMQHADHYYSQLEIKAPVLVKRIYLATDDPSVLQEARNKYPQYTILGSEEVAHSASVENRYSKGSLEGVIQDVYFLSKTDFLVCTLSSHVCRLSYELLNTRHVDASQLIRSPDNSYYFGLGIQPLGIAMYANKAQFNGDLGLSVGDRVEEVGNLWNGFSVGTMADGSGRAGAFFSYKVELDVPTAKFPSHEKRPFFSSH